MMTFIKRYGIIIFLVSLVFIALIAISMDPGIEQVPEGDSKAADFIFEGVSLVQYIDGEAKWEIDATHAEIYKRSDLANLKVVSGNIFDQGERRVSMNAPIAVIHLDSSQMNLDDPEVDYYIKDQVVYSESDSLLWDGKYNFVRATGNVKVRYPSVIIYGESLFVDVPAQKLTIENQSRAEVLF